MIPASPTAQPSLADTKLTPSRLLYKSRHIAKTLSVFILFGALLFLIQICVEGFVGVDAYYHVKISELMVQQGMFNQFPWTQISILKNHFADKDFLFHLYLIPFILIFPNLIIGGKVAIAVLGGILFSFFYRLLDRFQIRFAFLWTLIAFGINFGFLQRMCMVRPHVLSLVLTLFFIESLCRRQPWKLFMISLIYPLAYTAVHLLLLIAIIYLIVSWIHNRTLRGRLILPTLAGTTLGLVVHPYFPNNLRLWYVQNALLPVFNWGKSEEFWFVSEQTSLPTWVFIGVCGPILLLLGIAMAILILNRRNLNDTAPFVFVLACGFLVMTILSMRFVEYWVPFTVLSCALCVQAVKRGKSAILETAIKVGQLGMIGFSLVMYILAILVIPLKFKPELEDPANWLKNNTPQKTTIFTTAWADFPQLFYFNSQNYYLFGMDPVYCYAYDVNLWHRWVAIVSGQMAKPGVEITDVFHANYVLCTRNPKETPYALTEQLLQDNRFQIGYQDEYHFIFALKKTDSSHIKDVVGNGQ